jgi:hypothetical protein
MNKEKNQSSWFEFYFNRVGSAGYEKHFREKYALLISLVKSFSLCGLIKEEGIGIGSVAKAVGGPIYGSDICPKMLELCKINNPNINVWKEDIKGEKRFLLGTHSVVTHGVLEHFSDKDIISILDTYKGRVNFSLHYVPTDQYKEPSFGDERLLSVSYWVSKFKPFHHLTENQGKDLYLIFKHK